MQKELLKINGFTYYQKEYKMKYIYLTTIIFLFSCSSRIGFTNNVEMITYLQLTIIIDDETKMELFMKNNSDKILRFSDPTCYINSIIEIIGKEGKVQQDVKIKPDVNCRQNMISIGSGKEEGFTFPYSLNELFQLDSDEKYEILLSYKGGIIDSNGKVLKGNVSSRKQFVIN